ncbi:helix-turn-helix transcriptional regulator [Nocardia beijingensis]|uniref:helix-turn-helix domain-containing protein n=1 Tax=Nocardia beijingensis TaxID=95162 RepID=UPI00189637CA|nr:helix-turn-helix transcriptional regulator [Nocardia beijingensis]MBF6464435.1 helix-turn-helix transcriptional regulator [Nocardia beijingensis]
MNDIPPNEVGRRLREIRAWRGQSLEVVAGLAGISFGYLGRLERGEQALSNRATLEALARALRVSPSEFYPVAGQAGSRAEGNESAHAGVVAIERALDVYELGDDPGGAVRAWPAIAADLEQLAQMAQMTSDFAGQAELAPALLAELHAVYARSPELRRNVLLGLITCYASAMWVTKRLGGRGLPLVAAKAAQECAATLESPAWSGFTVWLRGDATGGLSRPEQYRRAVRCIDELSPHLNDMDVLQTSGMLHLSAALASAVQGDRSTAETHLGEATALAGRMETETGAFGRMWFGASNVGIWRACIGMEFGDGVKVAEDARKVNVDSIPSKSRQAEFYMEVGRALLTEPTRREQGIHVLLRAEHLAPQRVHADVLAREAVADVLRAARRDAGGRELRGLAWRLGIAPEHASKN